MTERLDFRNNPAIRNDWKDCQERKSEKFIKSQYSARSDDPHLPDDGILADLAFCLEKCDLVVLADMRGTVDLVGRFCRSDALRETEKRVAVFSASLFLGCPALCVGRHRFYRTSVREQAALLSLYRSYEVSDKLFLLSDSQNYGSTWNYVNSGMITEQEMFEAMFV